ncbi:tRNA preQ1(34) S-adenosylmethionine ribosyltransferase-isomerase QueA [Candidatus Nitrospira bockiana]
MLLSEFDLPFDPALVADRPVEPRDRARLLHLSRATGACSHHSMSDLPGLLSPGDLLVVNDSRVVPARLTGRKRPGGGRVELVLVKALGGECWQVLMKGGGKAGQVIDLSADASCEVVESGAAGTIIRLRSAVPLPELLARLGRMPLPPYIKRAPEKADTEWYQTMFAREEGSIAAPTAGLHFTPELVGRLRDAGIHTVSITLHVGPATFRPVRVTNVEDHPMLPEAVHVSMEAAAAITRTRSAGGRIVAVGTTVVRTLEAIADDGGTIRPYTGETSLFIIPGYRFRVVDALITNFHLPRTTLVMLVSAFAGLDRVRSAYREAVARRYRFYSYGDAMLIL